MDNLCTKLLHVCSELWKPAGNAVLPAIARHKRSRVLGSDGILGPPPLLPVFLSYAAELHLPCGSADIQGGSIQRNDFNLPFSGDEHTSRSVEGALWLMRRCPR